MGGTKKVRPVKAFRIQLSETIQSLLALTLYIIHTVKCVVVIFEMRYGFVSLRCVDSLESRETFSENTGGSNC